MDARIEDPIHLRALLDDANGKLHLLQSMMREAGFPDRIKLGEDLDGNEDFARVRPEAQLGDVLATVTKLTALLNTPELHDFSKAVVLEAGHQRERWGAAHDAGKNPEDWFWLIGYLAGKALAALKSGNREKALHHTISTAAVLANWHAAVTGQHTTMRPGIAEPVV